jgi:hypothetical protein
MPDLMKTRALSSRTISRKNCLASVPPRAWFEGSLIGVRFPSARFPRKAGPLARREPGDFQALGGQSLPGAPPPGREALAVAHGAVAARATRRLVGFTPSSQDRELVADLGVKALNT